MSFLYDTQADIIKIAMARIDKYLEAHRLEKDVYLLLQVHDELVYEIKEEKVTEIVKTIKEIMESVLSPKDTKGIPILVDVAVGKNWGGDEKISMLVVSTLVVRKTLLVYQVINVLIY